MEIEKIETKNNKSDEVHEDTLWELRRLADAASNDLTRLSSNSFSAECRYEFTLLAWKFKLASGDELIEASNHSLESLRLYVEGTARVRKLVEQIRRVEAALRIIPPPMERN